MKVSLIRHGRPAVDFASRIRGSEFAAWLRTFESAGIDPASPPPTTLLASLRDCSLVLTSPVARARASATRMGLAAPQRICDQAREAPLPRAIWFPLRAKPTVLIVFARIVWLLGWAQASEDTGQVRRRATEVVAELDAEAERGGHVALVTHGYFIRFLRPALQASGWRGSPSRELGYWSKVVYEK